ncbi:MAG: PA domain-containing protein [Bacteroidota bacterium]
MKKALLSILGLVAGISMNAQVIFRVNTPASVSGNYDLTYALAANSWGVADLTDPANSKTGTLAFVDDGTAADSLGCNNLVNGAALAGKIAVVYRGSCSFGIKAQKAQQAGAIAVVIINNTAGLINMQGGAEGLTVTVPVINIDNANGAILKSAIEAGTATAFIGSKLGAFPNDLSWKDEQYLVPGQAARPATMSSVAGDFVIKSGLWIHNLGSAAQTGATATASISKVGGGQVFSDAKPGLSIAKGDSIYVAFGDFGGPFTTGDYNLVYTLAPAGAEGDPSDNVKTISFQITETGYAYANVNAQGLVIPTSYIKPGSGTNPFTYCIPMREQKADQHDFLGFSFATTPQGTHLLNGEFVEFSLYEWNDIFEDTASEFSVDDLTEVGFSEYTYENEALKETPIFTPTDRAYTMKSNQRYLACGRVNSDSLYFGYNDDVEYSFNRSQLKTLSFFPVQIGTTWYSGFTGGNGAGVGLMMRGPGVGINKTAVINAEGTPFPTPASQYVNIPFNANGAKSATISVVDITGKVVANLTANVDGKNLHVNTTTLSAGSYVFNVTLDNGAASSFRVLIGK